jgi:hypothetical protein
VSDRILIRIGWTATAISLVLGALAVAFLLVPPRPGVSGAEVTVVQAVADAGFLLVSPVMALLIIRANPRNVIGWLFLAFSGLLGLGFFGDGIARHVPPSAAVAWLVLFTASISNGAFTALVLLIVTFPTGRLLSPRWRWIVVVIGLGTAGLLVPVLFASYPISGIHDLRNPMAVPGWDPVLEIMSAAGSLSIIGSLAAAVTHLVARIRRARGVERQQLKWFVLAAAIVGSLLLLAAITQPLGPISDVIWGAAFTAFPVIPAATAIAILRHRLFDIDLLIKRTVAYAALSLVLVAAYAGGVLLLQLLLEPFTRQGELAVAGSTLVVAALFQPARRRIQRAVDRRFDRARYDAQAVVAAFGGRLRDGLDLDSVADEIAATVNHTVRPASVSVWLRRIEDRS